MSKDDGTADAVDVVVVGGGPGGSATASFIAKEGHRVLLLERETFPRYQIGESLLPSTVHGICAMLGVSDEIAAAGFPRKLGGTFRWGRDPAPWTFTFGSSAFLPSSRAYAYQVERAVFDDILLRNARRLGVDVRERCTVTGTITEGERVVGVRYMDEHGVEHAPRAAFVVDASGNQTGLSRDVGERIYSRFFQNVALFGYYEGGRRLPAPNDGNILCVAFEDGWFWYIPLSATLTSVGAVVTRDKAGAMRDGHEEALTRFVEACPMIRDYLRDARRVTEGRYGPIRIRKDYSYCHSRFWRPGMVLVGDAACFIDPVFSSGVHLATYSGLLAARSINTCLAGTLDETRCFDEFESRYLREYAHFYQFLLAIYDMHGDEASYFWAARKILTTEERQNEAFIQLVAGVSAHDPAYRGADEFFAARSGLGEAFQRLADGRADTIGELPFDTSRFDPGRFMEEFMREGAQVQVQARLDARRPAERPLFAQGLIPSADGLHWREATPQPATASGGARG